MKESFGDLFAMAAQKVIVITTNGTLRSDGSLVMGGGCAKQAKIKWPEIPTRVGDLVRNHGNHTYFFTFPGYQAVVTMPTKYHWKDKSEIDLVRRSAIELKTLADENDWAEIYVPTPGCGLGGLDWNDVRPVLEPIFDDRFIIVGYSK